MWGCHLGHRSHRGGVGFPWPLIIVLFFIVKGWSGGFPWPLFFLLPPVFVAVTGVAGWCARCWLALASAWGWRGGGYEPTGGKRKNDPGGDKPKRDPNAPRRYVATSDGEIVEVVD